MDDRKMDDRKIDQDRQARIALLGGCSLLAGVPREVLALLADRTAETHYAANQQIFFQGDAGDELLMVIEGRVKITAASLDGKEVILNTIEAGGVFGEMALIDSEPRSASAVAGRASRLLRLHRRDLIPVLQAHPDLALSIMRELSAKLRRTTAQYEELMFLSVAGRLARWLATTAESQGGTADGALEITPGMTQEEIGQSIGATRERVNKVLQSWLDEGLIERKGRRIRIPDLDAILAITEP